jgi:hypothetical protein
MPLWPEVKSRTQRHRLAAAKEAKRARKETPLGEVKRLFDRAFAPYAKGFASEEETEERKALETELAAISLPHRENRQR